MTRREFLAASAAATASAQNSWNAGPVRHLLPAVNHERLLLKASFTQPQMRPPVLRAGNARVEGLRTDTESLFWQFDVRGLKPATLLELQIMGPDRRPLTDPWPLRTFPAPDAAVDRFRLMVYTCAGGHDSQPIPETGEPYWVSVANRRKLLKAGLAMEPDAMIAIGDHVYWDQRSGKASTGFGAAEWARKAAGSFDRTIPVLGTPNEKVLKRAVDPQIVDLYGTMFRSVPVHFLQDDHDYFDNDEATETVVTFPPDDFMMRLARSTQNLYYPEFLPDASRPLGLPGASYGDRLPGISESYGTLRFGERAEILLYDCRRYLTLTSHLAGFLPDTVEKWLMNRMQSADTTHLINLPSTPIGWSAGKWGEWYPDLLGGDGKLSTARPKLFWQSGWRGQHDRLLAAASAMPRMPVFLSGDLHALAVGKIVRNGRQDLRRNPVLSVLTGPISTGPRGWPSSARGTPPQVPTGLEVDENLPPLENNGLTIADFHADRIEFQFFRWKIGQPESALDGMKPFHKFTLQRTV